MAIIEKPWTKKTNMVTVKPVCDICGKELPETQMTAEEYGQYGCTNEGGVDMIHDGIYFSIENAGGVNTGGFPAICLHSKYVFLCTTCYNNYVNKIVETLVNKLNFELE